MPVIAGKGGSYIGGPSAVGAALPFTYFNIIEKNPVHFWRCNTDNGGTTGNGAGDLGSDPFFLTAFATIIEDAENPMPVSEPLTSAADFGGTSGRYANNTGSQVNVDAFLTGTVIVFFKPQTHNSHEYLYSQNNTGGATQFRMALRGDQSPDIIDFFISVDGGGTNGYTSSLDIGTAITNNFWHMAAVRQPADGSHILWFLDGNFFIHTDSEITETLNGFGVIGTDVWSEQTVVGPTFPATERSIGAFGPSGILGFDGREFNVVVTDDVWAASDLTNLWQRALDNGMVIA